jgi:hypothetical protein
MSWDEDACYDTSLDIPSGKFGKLIAIPGGPGPSGPPGPEGPASTVPGPPGPAGQDGASSWDDVQDKPEGVPGGFPVLDDQGQLPVETLPDGVELVAQKGVAGGYAPLNADSAVVADYALVEGGQGTNQLRLVGRLTTEGPPTAGAWKVGDIVHDKFGGLYRCVVAGTPGQWNNMSPGFMDQVPVHINRFASYVFGGAVTLSATPTSLPLKDASRMITTGGVIIISKGMPEGQPELRILARYTGVSGNSLTGVVTLDGSTKTVPDLTPVYWGQSGLASSYLRVANGIIARSGVDNLPHDLVLCAARDDSGRSNRADYDMYFTREAGSTGILMFGIPIRFGEDITFSEANGVELLTFSGGTANGANGTNPTPLPSGTILVHGDLVGSWGTSSTNLRLMPGDSTGKVLILNSAKTLRLGVDESGAYLPNSTNLRFLHASNANLFGAISSDASNRLGFQSPGAGYRFLNNAFNKVLLAITEDGSTTIANASATQLSAAATVNADMTGTAGAQLGVRINPNVNQSGTAGYTALFISPTETAVGTGFKRLIDCQIAGVNKFLVTNTGLIGVDAGIQTLATAADPNLNLSGWNAGVVKANGTQVEVKGHTHVAADVVGAEATARKGVANGYAPLDATSKVPVANLPARWAAVPASATAPGTAGDVAYDSTHMYVCVANSSWKTIAYDATWKA